MDAEERGPMCTGNALVRMKDEHFHHCNVSVPDARAFLKDRQKVERTKVRLGLWFFTK